MANTTAFLVNVANNKKEMTLHEDICAVIGRGILPSLTDKRCSRHQAEITYRSDSQDALLYVVGPTPVAVQRGSNKPHLVNVNESYTLSSGDCLMLIPDIDTKFEFQSPGGPTTPQKTNEDEEGETKRKRSDDEDDGMKKKYKKKKHPCKYGANCYRNNPEHLQQYSHGEDSEDSSSNEKPKTPKADKPKSTEKKDKSKPTEKKDKNAYLKYLTTDNSEDSDEPNNAKKIKLNEKKKIPNDEEDDEEIIPLANKGGRGEDENEENDEKGEKAGDEEGEDEIKPLHVMAEGESVAVQGDSGTEHKMKYIGGVYSCSCHAWRNQSLPIDNRTCKHLRTYLGDEFESRRLKRKIAAAVAPKAFVQKKVPNLLLAHKWETHIDPTNYWVSEKLDGVRAYWDGTNFISRLGNPFPAPEYFTSVLPKDTPLDGELWCGRKKFQTTVSIVKSMDTGGRWKDVSYQVFDAPSMSGPVEERYDFLHKLVDKINVPYVSVVKTKKCTGAEDLKKQLEKIEALGGEGLMLRQPASKYVGGRSMTLLKVKSFVDAEAIVRGHEDGKGKHKGKLGSLLVELANGVRVNVGTGFSDAERAAPPPIGSIITFRYQELTDAGVPRFPAYLRIRTDVTKWPPKKE